MEINAPRKSEILVGKIHHIPGHDFFFKQKVVCHAVVKCSFCSKYGYTEENCRLKHKQPDNEVLKVPPEMDHTVAQPVPNQDTTQENGSREKENQDDPIILNANDSASFDPNTDKSIANNVTTSKFSWADFSENMVNENSEGDEDSENPVLDLCGLN
ncbi:hypothetical protein NE237_029363 [Protea cynaroides]|uniref:Uncharacterized protein n=1 Tax=Protea cynaroides TaxID=273540 RepID=A0A9Q0JUQ6_9MAGN|nr:hypothetical protein NE237_029363 [Protea cynaroides]